MSSSFPTFQPTSSDDDRAVYYRKHYVSPVKIGGVCLGFVASLTSLLCSILVVYLIYKGKKSNGFIKVVYHLGISQIFYDASFFILLGLGEP